MFAYHEQTKHHLQRYARSLGYMDWDTQPDPFRTYAGAEQLPLEHPSPSAEPSYDQLYTPLSVQAVNRSSVSRLFFNSLAISAWKQAGSSKWSLRVNPSSGALHPTEGYLIAGPIDELAASGDVFHYAPSTHALERRRTLSAAQWAALTAGWPSPCVFVALTSIHWRESWKYGERAFRYCHLDVGHAIGAVALAGQLLGWQARLVPIAADDLALLLGVQTQHGPEAEHPDCLLALFAPSDAALPSKLSFTPSLRDELASADPAGVPNRLSDSHHDWPIIDGVAAATHDISFTFSARAPSAKRKQEQKQESARSSATIPAEQIIRQRRSAVDMDGKTSLSRDTFLKMLARVVPALTPLPFAVMPSPPRVALALFVNRVEGLPSGLYLLARDARQEAELRPRLDSRFVWQKPAACPDELGLYLLAQGDARRYAKLTSCHQDIAADGAFAAAMLAEFDAVLRADGPAAYCRLHWEAGLIGQLLYLEAEAAGIRATGIGCFFDDATHELLGLQDRAWQTVYHFTVGGPVEDPRLQTLAAYHHLHAHHASQ